MPLANALAHRFAHVALTQDWHASGHLSLASSHPGRAPFETITLPYGAQILWPEHCVQGSFGAEFSAALSIPKAELIVRKGYRRAIDTGGSLAAAWARMRKAGVEKVMSNELLT